MLPFLFVALIFGISSLTVARKWNNDGTGTIALEEAWTVPQLIDFITATPPLGEPFDEFKASFLDVHGRRLDLMNENNIDFVSVSDPVAAAALAISVNDQLSAAISNNTARFGGFASLSMHNATEAAQELRRSVKELGLLGLFIIHAYDWNPDQWWTGAMLNDFQQSGPDNGVHAFQYSSAGLELTGTMSY
ncbi:hypothetical protein C0991_004533 [Blastosporella zonata]|nr:hypothetical protein C0991_004533 [Blastosporella zonata]